MAPRTERRRERAWRRGRAETADPGPQASPVVHDCIERARCSVCNGNVTGLINTADALAAVKRLVRVVGLSAQFVSLLEDLQDETIARTAHAV